ncbi:unnamed protein product, partial [Polarella glacialis]
LAWHGYFRLLRLQAPGCHTVAAAGLGTLRPKEHRPPLGAMLGLVWACFLAAIVLGTHAGGLASHYDHKVCLKSIKCWRAWIVTAGFCLGSASLALGYVYAEFRFLRTGVRTVHFLQTNTFFIADELDGPELPREGKRKQP